MNPTIATVKNTRKSAETYISKMGGNWHIEEISGRFFVVSN